MAFTVLYLLVIVLVPLLTLPVKSFSEGWSFFWDTIRDPRVIASYRLTLGASFVAACVNGVLGIVVAWVLVRYDFPGRRIVDAMIDLPFALPTAVAGITLTSLYAPNGWFGQFLAPFGVQGVFSPLGITIALIFIGLPFVVRTLQPVIADLDVELEEVATSLGANRVQVVFRVILPYLYPAWLIGFGMAFARAIGEYGSVVFIAGNMPMKTEIASLLIITKLTQYRLRGRGGDCVRAPAPLLLAPAHPQCAPGLEHEAAGLLTSVATNQPARPARPGLTEPVLVRLALTTLALGFLFVFLFVPFVFIFVEALRNGWQAYVGAIRAPEALSAIWLTLLVAALTVPANAVFGIAAAWAITRFDFRGKRLLTTLIDLPFAVSPVVAGLIFVQLFGRQGWFGPWLFERDIRIIFAVPGIVLATVFVSFPFVARELIAVMEASGREEEEAASLLGANGWQMFRRVTLPNVKWALISGVILCTARAMGEFGAVSVVSGRIRGETTTVPIHVEILYNEYAFQASFAVASLLAVVAVVTLVLQTVVEQRNRRALDAVVPAEQVQSHT